MSYTEVFGVEPNGDLVSLAECRNSFRGAMWIWMELSKRYLGRNFSILGGGLDELFGTAHKMSKKDRMALLTTADNVLVAPEHFEEFAQVLEEFEPGTENLKQQAAALRTAQKLRMKAVCWNQTSVNGDAWVVGTDDDEGEEVDRLFNLDRDLDHKKYRFIAPDTPVADPASKEHTDEDHNTQ